MNKSIREKQEMGVIPSDKFIAKRILSFCWVSPSYLLKADMGKQNSQLLVALGRRKGWPKFPAKNPGINELLWTNLSAISVYLATLFVNPASTLESYQLMPFKDCFSDYKHSQVQLQHLL